MQKLIPGGLLVILEGIDGAGKTSCATALAQWCGERGLACCFSKEPTGELHGQKLRTSAESGRLSLEQELELFHADRRAHVQRSIRPMLDEGGIVILDRYYWSTAAYQGARGIDPQVILATNRSFAPVPDLVILLDLPVAEGLQRIRARGDAPNQFEDTENLEKARQIFLKVAQTEPGCELIESSKPLREIIQQSLRAFKKAAAAKIAAAAPGSLTPAQLSRAEQCFNAV
jgi:dTMP kinase